MFDISSALRGKLVAVVCVFVGALTSGTTGCGRGYPSYSGTYRLKETIFAEANLPIHIRFPEQMQVIQYPFVLYNGVVDTRVAIGSTAGNAKGLYFKQAPLTPASGTSVQFSVVPGETFPDFASDRRIEPNGRDLGPSCLYTFGAEARFEFSFSLDKMTDAVEGVYPRMIKETVGGHEYETRPPGQWSDRPINYGVWDSQEKQLTIHFSIYRRNAYGNLGICNYQGSAVPLEPISYNYSAVYTLVDEQASFDPRVPSEDSSVFTEIENQFGKEPAALWSQTFDVPANAGQLRSLFQ